MPRFFSLSAIMIAAPSLFLAAACMTNATATAAARNEVVLLQDAGEFAGCEAKQSELDRTECNRTLLAEYPWKIIIYHARGITGANDTYVPDAVEVLEEMAERCELGRTILSYHTDGVASLMIKAGADGLSTPKIDCIRSYERPGLTLQEAQGF